MPIKERTDNLESPLHILVWNAKENFKCVWNRGNEKEEKTPKSVSHLIQRGIHMDKQIIDLAYLPMSKVEAVGKSREWEIRMGMEETMS